MAFSANEGLTSQDVAAANIAIAKRLESKVFAAGTGTLLPLTPVAIVTSSGNWAPMTSANSPTGTNLVRGFVWPDSVVLKAGNEVNGLVLVEGTILAEHMPAAFGTTALLAILNPARDGQLATLGIRVDGTFTA